MPVERYIAPAGAGKAELTEKRSKFIACVVSVDDEDAAKAHIARVRAKHHDARHNCWCYIIRNGPERYSDDGEPQGTAGLPMFEVFKRGGISNVCCVVTRYFGGILLGPGGLARAYSEAAKMALNNAGTTGFRRYECVRAVCPYHLHGRIKSEFENSGAVIEGIDYGEAVVFRVLVAEGESQGVGRRLADISSGTVSCVVTGTKYCPSPE